MTESDWEILPDGAGWRPVFGWEGFYEVSDTGLVRSVARRVPFRTFTRTIESRVLKPAVGRGYAVVGLQRGGKAFPRKIHRLVLEAFVEPRPEGMEGCHFDGNKLNNHLSNLRWGTRSDNMRDNVRLGRNRWAVRDQCGSGHTYTAETTRVLNGTRHCRICARQYRAAWLARRMQEAQ